MERSTALNILIIEEFSHTLVLWINQKSLMETLHSPTQFYLFLMTLTVEGSSDFSFWIP